ncbi:MAG: threonylcarbamoyl-AMP synthase [Lachnospiraceae bacterium]|nr:threonylcarbamoyl-AMP synthase [Lachnospiraceae bacterium]
MITEIRKIDKNQIDREAMSWAGEIIRQGGLVAFPTETVYGLGADARNASAAKKIYEAKGRPSDNPLIVHIAEYQSLSELAKEVTPEARLLAETFWPGPLTLIVKKNDTVPNETTGGLDTVAVRMPDHSVALELIRQGGGYIAAPSANTSGKPSPTRAEHVAFDLDGKIPLILDGGPVGVGIESTIVDLTGDCPMILRPGYITREMLAEVIGDVKVDPALAAADSVEKPRAPGMKYRHYAPQAELVLVDGDPERVVDKINELADTAIAAGWKVGIIGTDETILRYSRGETVSIGTRRDEDGIAQNLYRILREFDDRKVDKIYSECFSDLRIGQAVMNRLLKAAAFHIVEV